MPWKVFKSGNEYCVHKLKKDGSKGRKEGCHSSKNAANEQVSALYASESESESEPEDTDMSKAVDIEVDIEISDESESEDNEEIPMDGMSYNEMIQVVSEAWYKRNGDGYYSSGYVSEVFPDHVIARVDKYHWKVAYSINDDDGEVSFVENDQWEKVELKKEWVAKHISNLFTIKSLAPKTDGEARIGGYGILWGDKEHTDLQGEYFTKSTGQLTKIFDAMGSIPFMFNHGADGKLKATVIGEVDTMEVDDVGLWYEARIKEHKLYRKYVEPLLENDALFSSSGVLPVAKKSVKATGEITQWPIVEMTGTHVPAEHRMLNAPIATVKSFYHNISTNGSDIDNVFKSIGVEEEESNTEPMGDEKSQVDELAEKLFEAQLNIENLNLYSLELEA